MIRSHEVRQPGYSIEHGGQCITVFSAPNYVDQVGNKAAVVRIDDAGNLTFTTFEAQPHPDVKPMACESRDARAWATGKRLIEDEQTLETSLAG